MGTTKKVSIKYAHKEVRVECKHLLTKRINETQKKAVREE
jgi:hypothetical protein